MSGISAERPVTGPFGREDDAGSIHRVAKDVPYDLSPSAPGCRNRPIGAEATGPALHGVGGRAGGRC